MALPSFDQVKSPITRRAAALGTAAFMGAAAIFGSSAASAEPSDLCRKAVAIGNAITDRHKVSSALAKSFEEFAKSECADIDWQLSTPVDHNAFKEFRVRMVVLKRTAQVATPSGR